MKLAHQSTRSIRLIVLVLTSWIFFIDAFQEWNPYGRRAFWSVPKVSEKDSTISENNAARATALNDSDALPSTINAKSDPYEAIAFPSYRLDLTPESKIPQDSKLFLRWPSNRRKDIVYCDESSSSAIMARLWRVAAEGVPTSVAFPNAVHRITVRQFVDLLDFLNEHASDDCKLQVSYDHMDGIAVLRFTSRLGSDGEKADFIQYDSNRIEKRIQAWVKRVLVNLRICPFTKSIMYSGQGVPNVPVAKIDYGTSSAKSISALLADAWDSIDNMLVAGPTKISSILLAAPYFDDRFPLWAGVLFCLLEHSVIAARATSDVGVVCFHPEYQTPDGSSFPGFGHMHSVGRLQSWAGTDRRTAAAGGAWQRRTPHAVINVLRAEQLTAAETLRSTPDLYRDNIMKLMDIADDLPIALLREQRME